MNTIYYLQNPLNDQIFYVGVTECSLDTRLIGHCSQPSTPTAEVLVSNGMKPMIVEIDAIEGHKEEGRKLEEYWIHQFCAWGFPLENKTVAFGRKYIPKKKVKSESIIEMQELCSKKILSISDMILPEDRKALMSSLSLPYATAHRYIKGKVYNIDLGLHIYQFLKHRIEKRKSLLSA